MWNHGSRCRSRPNPGKTFQKVDRGSSATSYQNQGMVFVGRRTFKLVHESVNVAYFFKVVPFRWIRRGDGQGFMLEVPAKSKGKLCAWDLVKYFFLVHQVYLTVRLVQSILADNAPLSSYAIQCIYYAQFLLASIFELSIITNGHDWMIFINQYLQFFKCLEGKFM